MRHKIEKHRAGKEVWWRKPVMANMHFIVMQRTAKQIIIEIIIITMIIITMIIVIFTMTRIKRACSSQLAEQANTVGAITTLSPSHPSHPFTLSTSSTFHPLNHLNPPILNPIILLFSQMFDTIIPERASSNLRQLEENGSTAFNSFKLLCNHLASSIGSLEQLSKYK